MEKIFSIQRLKLNMYDASDCIVIPKWILDSILNLIKKRNEYAGYLIVNDNIVEYVYISSEGTAASVVSTKKVIFNGTTQYRAIEFHTHPSALGDTWSDKFSQGDYTTFENRSRQEGEQYQHILFTAKNILTWSQVNPPDIRIGFGNTDMVREKFAEWNKKYLSWTP